MNQLASPVLNKPSTTRFRKFYKLAVSGDLEKALDLATGENLRALKRDLADACQNKRAVIEAQRTALNGSIWSAKSLKSGLCNKYDHDRDGLNTKGRPWETRLHGLWVTGRMDSLGEQHYRLELVEKILHRDRPQRLGAK